MSVGLVYLRRLFDYLVYPLIYAIPAAGLAVTLAVPAHLWAERITRSPWEWSLSVTAVVFVVVYAVVFFRFPHLWGD